MAHVEALSAFLSDGVLNFIIVPPGPVICRCLSELGAKHKAQRVRLALKFVILELKLFLQFQVNLVGIF